MDIIYHCYGGTHSSVLAAALHTGVISHRRPPEGDRLINLPFLDTQDGGNHGRLYFFGKDEHGNKVYILGRRRDVEALTLVLNGALNEAQRVLLVNALPCVPLLLKLGGYISRRLKLARVGRPLVCAGLRRAYPCLHELVYRVKLETCEA
ncbi:MAG TPA: DUF3189 family protein [Desulfotomaculum sp.]|nr:DUF3189 family protein [Desulfotomaculum sp.]